MPLLCLLNWQAGSLPTSATWEALFQYDSVRDMASLVAQIVKNLRVRQETCIQFLGWEDPLEEDIATNGQYSCLENSKDRGAWQATVHGVTKSLTRLRD